MTQSIALLLRSTVSLLLALATVAFLLLAPMAALAGTPEISMVANCQECASVEEIVLPSKLQLPREKSFKATSFRLIVMNEQGEVLASFESILDSASAPGKIVPRPKEILSNLTIGSYRVVLKVNDLYSNVIRVNIRPALNEISGVGTSCQGSLQIEPMVDLAGREYANSFLAYFRNQSTESVILPYRWAGSRMLVDGMSFRLRGFRWMGLGDLWPGKSWGTIVDIDLFFNDRKEKVPPGNHTVQFLFGDCISNEIQVKVEK